MSHSVGASQRPSLGPLSPRTQNADFTCVVEPVEQLLAWERHCRNACQRLLKIMNKEKLQVSSKLSEVFEANDTELTGSLGQQEWARAMEVVTTVSRRCCKGSSRRPWGCS